MIANSIGGYLGGGGNAFTNWAKGDIFGAFTAGALTGAVAGAISSAVYGGNWGKNMLEGAQAGQKVIAGMKATKELVMDLQPIAAEYTPGIGEPSLITVNANLGGFWKDFASALWEERGKIGAAGLDGFQAWADGVIPFADPFKSTYNVDEMGFSRAMGGVSQEALTTAAGLRGAAWFGKTKAGYWLNHNRYLRIGPGNIPRGRPFTYGPGQGVPTMRIGNGTPTWYNHFDLRIFGH